MTLELLAAVAKLTLYTGALIGAGTALAWASLGDSLGKVQAQAPRRIAVGAAAAALAALSGTVLLLLRLGGLEGPILAAVLGTPAGASLGLQVGGGGLLIATARGAAQRPLRLLGGGLLLASFGLSGHAAAAGFLSGTVATLHLLAAAWWFGSLLLLRSACRTLPGGPLAALVGRFGRLALFVVGGMIGSGAVVVFVLVGPTLSAWGTPYARSLTAKIALACCALALAVYARSRLVPRLAHDGTAAATILRRVVTIEAALLAATLAATAWLTTFHSPHGGH